MSQIKFDKIYVLAINHSEEKYNDISQRLSELDIPYNTPYEILLGHNGWVDELPNGFSAYKNWAIDTENTNWKFDVTPGEIGCAISHYNSWKTLITDDVERALILEEDFKSEIPLTELSEPPKDYDIAYLGRWAIDYDSDIKLNEQWYIPSFSYNAQSYILTRTGANKILSYNFQSNLIPPDEFLTTTWCYHPRPDINNLWPSKQINAVATKDDYISQTSDIKTSMVSVCGDSDIDSALKRMRSNAVLD